MILTICLIIFDKRSLVYLVKLIRKLQIILHVPLIRILIPSNVNHVFTILFLIITYDVLPPEYTFELVLDFDYDQHDKDSQ